MNGPAMITAAIEAAEPFVPEPETTCQPFARLAALSRPEYERIRRTEAARLEMRVSILDAEVDKIRHEVEVDSGVGGGFLRDPEAWPLPVDGAELLDQMTTVIQSHLVLPPRATGAIALWTVFSHAHDCFDISPILAVTSPTPECGKTTLMTMLCALVPRALSVSHITPAALFRSIDKWRPTLLVDEADTFLPGNEDLRGVLNSGHYRANAFVLRTTGDDHEPRPFSTWAPKAIALIGKLPATLASRAIHIELRRMTAAEKVKPLRLDRLGHLEPLLGKAARWTADNAARLRSSEPKMPPTLYGRAADNLRPLVAIADLAGGDWPSRARHIAEVFGGRQSQQTTAIMLLEDVKRIFAERQDDKISSADLANALAELEVRPWPEWYHGKPITKVQVAKLLDPFGVRPSTIRTASGTIKGYKRASFDDAFARYLERDAVTPSQPAESAASGPDVIRHNKATVTAAIPPDAAQEAVCDGVTADSERPWEEEL